MRKYNVLIYFIVVLPLLLSVFAAPIAPDFEVAEATPSPPTDVKFNVGIGWDAVWRRLHRNVKWLLEVNQGKGWEEVTGLNIHRSYPEEDTCKIELEFTALYTGDYRLTFAFSKKVANYLHKEGALNYTLEYAGYKIIFDWSDLLQYNNLQLSHGVKDKFFWFRIKRDNVPKGAHVTLDPTLIYSGGTTGLPFQHHIHYASGDPDRWYVFYRGANQLTYSSSSDNWAADNVTGLLVSVDGAPPTSTDFDVACNGTHFLIINILGDVLEIWRSLYVINATYHTLHPIAGFGQPYGGGGTDDYPTCAFGSSDQEWFTRNDQEGDGAIAVFRNADKDGTYTQQTPPSRNHSGTKKGYVGFAAGSGQDMYSVWVEDPSTATMNGSFWDQSDGAWESNESPIGSEQVDLGYNFAVGYTTNIVYVAFRDNTDDHIYVTHSTADSGSWTTPQDLSGIGAVGGPQIIVHETDDIIWVLWGDTDKQIWGNRRAGGAWSKPNLLAVESVFSDMSVPPVVADTDTESVGFLYHGSDLYFDELDLGGLWFVDIIVEGTIDDWVFAEEQYYVFNATYSNDVGYEYIDTVKMNFSDGYDTIVVVYDAVTAEFSIEEGEEKINLHAGTVTGSGDYLSVDFEIFFEGDIIDAQDIDVNFWSNDTDGITQPWATVGIDIFHIYNMGGLAQYTVTGASGHTDGGDIFELYAGGTYPADIFEDNFDQGFISNEWLQREPFGDKITIVTEQYVTPKYSVKIDDDSAATYFMIEYTPTDPLTGTFTWETHIRLAQTNAYFDIEGFSDPYRPIFVQFNNTGHINFMNSTPALEYLQTYAANTWYNVTLVINVATDTYDIYINDVLKKDDGGFWSAVTEIDDFQVVSGSDHVATTGIAFVDNVKLWKTSSGGTGGNVVATQVWRNLQHIHTQFAVEIPRGDSILDHTDEGYIEFGIDYFYNNAWITNGWNVRINITDAQVVGPALWRNPSNWIELNVTWYNRASKIKSDILYTFWEGYGGEADYFRLWLDLWFNKVNASTTVGGRVSTYYYGMHETSISWFTWLTGSNWGPRQEDLSQSMYFHDLEDSGGNVITCREIGLFRIRTKVWRSASYDYEWKLSNFDLLSILTALPQEKMRGIDTPAFVATKTPDMPQGGLVASLIAGIASVGRVITDALTWGALGIWSSLVQFLDTIGSWLGYPNAFTNFTAYLTSFFSYLTDAMANLGTMMTEVFTFFLDPVVKMLTYIGLFFSNILTTLTTMVNIVTGAYGWSTDLFDYFNLADFITLFFVFTVPIMMLQVFKNEGIGGIWRMTSTFLDILSFFISLFIRIANFVIGILVAIVEAIPLIE